MPACGEPLFPIFQSLAGELMSALRMPGKSAAYRQDCWQKTLCQIHQSICQSRKKREKGANIPTPFTAYL